MFLFKDKKSGYYYVYYTQDNKRKKVSCKTKMKTDALRFIQSFSTEPTEPKPIVKDINALKIEVMKYVKTNFRIKTVFEYENVLKLFSAIAGDKKLNEITVTDAEMFKTMRLKTVKIATLNKDIGTLRAVFNYGIKLKWINYNPFREVNKISIPDKERLAFNSNEITSLLSVIDNSTLKSFVLFGLYTGCRLNEIINLQFKDIDFQNELVTIRNKKGFSTKTGKMRQIPMNNSLRDLLRTLFTTDKIIELNKRNSECYVFQKENGFKYTGDYITHKFKKYLRRAGISERFHFHCLRHTFITQLIKAGVNINYVKEIAGHSTIGTTMNYIHISTNDLRDAVNRINII